MAATYTILYQDRSGRGKNVQTVSIAYSSETYSSGLSVSGDKLGCPNNIDSLVVYDSQGFHAAYNGGKIRLYEQDGTTGDLTEVSGDQTITVKVVATGW
jgi:hypothetical protein